MIDFLFDLLDQGSTNLRLLAKTILLPVSINTYWNTAKPVCVCIVCGCFHATVAKLGNFNRDHMAHEVKNIY